MSIKKDALLVFACIAVTAVSVMFPGRVLSHESASERVTNVSTEAASATPPFPELTLNPGDFYFSVNGKQSFIFSRNVAAYYQTDYDTLLYWSKNSGTSVIRVGLDNLVMGGYGYTNRGEVVEAWAKNWESLFDKAAAKGIYVLPFFTGWVNWNTTGYNTWLTNPFNASNDGPAKTPVELFRSDSPTQQLWLKWLRNVVSRWHGYKNILAWEVYSEVNFTGGVSEKAGVQFVERAAAVVREADSGHRPITASLADVGEWPSFYRSSAVEFINFHPYPPSGKLDSYTLREVRRYLAKYGKPVLIGESGLNAATPDSEEGKTTIAPNAETGIKHAIWAQLVAGAMNGRAFFWEDGYGVYFPALGWPFLKKYAESELPVVRFISDVDTSGFKPITAQFSRKIVGAVLGNEKMSIGWFRDSGCEPPHWEMQSTISKQSVVVAVPGSAPTWQVDFYSTTTGTDIVSSVQIARKGNTVSIPLPDFTDDIAFKMYVK